MLDCKSEFILDLIQSQVCRNSFALVLGNEKIVRGTYRGGPTLCIKNKRFKTEHGIRNVFSCS